MIPYAGKVFHPAAADQYDRVLLEVVTDTGDIRRDLHAIREPHAGYLPESRVRLLGRCGIDPDADTPLLRAALERGALRFARCKGPAFSYQLTDGRHVNYSLKTRR